jgi:hypothetical protein
VQINNQVDNEVHTDDGTWCDGAATKGVQSFTINLTQEPKQKKNRSCSVEQYGQYSLFLRESQIVNISNSRLIILMTLNQATSILSSSCFN